MSLAQAPRWAFVALGSNLGDSPRIIREAMADLQRFSTRPLLRSSLWVSDPVDCPPDSPQFINAVAALSPSPTLSPRSLLSELQTLERKYGRVPKTVHNEARRLDLDLISFGTRIDQTEELCLPHPRAHLRRFVLEPMAEIAPELVLPGQSETIRELLAHLDQSQQVRRLEPA